ncbi:MAG: helix-turn-helix domain-containing protein [Chloroflexi bacterium]|nr:helix-turn-helix domain-containing protein [Chloroflexota bacterium]
MDSVRIGLSIRALRRRRAWTQAELGRRCGCSASEVSRVERGAVSTLTVRRLDRIVDALGARLTVRVLWRGEDLDRLLDRDHAAMVEVSLRALAGEGWVAFPEVTFHVAGERGSIDILAWHPVARAVLVIEIKSAVPDVQATLYGIDRKARLGPVLAWDRGWDPVATGRVLVLPDDRTSRRRVDRHSATFDRALPARTAAVKRWIASPSHDLAGVLFLSNARTTQARQRVPRTRPHAERGPTVIR